MRGIWNENNTVGHRQQKKSKRHARQVFITSFLLSFCCVTVFAINLLVSNFQLTIDNQPNIPLSPDVVINTDFPPSPVENIQVNDFEHTSGVEGHSNSDWYLILVNKWNCIPEDYEVELMMLSNGQSVDTRIYPALQEMFNAARGNGIYPVVVSGYRTTEKQQSLMDTKIAEYKALGYSVEYAIASAEAWVAIPGTSEHQLGIAVDINADGVNSAGHEVYDWLEKNAHKYGFILRYPADKTEITEVIYEPWHYRYVGVEAATEIYNQGVCLEEYLMKGAYK